MPLALQRPSMGGDTRADRVAVIDIGSNSIRLVVYDGLKRAPLPVFNEKLLCGLGRGLAKSGHLHPEGVQLAVENLVRFRRLADGMRAGRIDVLATAAVREATDGSAFIEAVERRTGLNVQIIAGEEEARLAALGVLAGAPDAAGFVGDLGGGSLELVALDNGGLNDRVTLPLGPLRLMEQGTPRQNGLVRFVEQQFETLPWLARMKGGDFHPVGGSWRAIAKLHMEHTQHPLHIIHNYTIAAAEAREFAEFVSRLSKSSLEKMSGGSRRRIDTLPYAALVFERLLRATAPARVVFSAYGLREGHLYSLLPDELKRQDPLLSACADLAERMDGAGGTEFLYSWTDGLFAGEDEAGRRLREAACHLSEMAWAEHPDYRAEHAYQRTLRFPFPAIEHADRAFLALVAHARYAGTVDDPVTLPARGLVSEGRLGKALVLGLALRLAHTLTGGAASLLRRTSLKLSEDEVLLALPDDTGVLTGDVVERRLNSLAGALNRTGRIVA